MHPDSEKTIKFLTDLGELHKRKAADYGTDEDPFYGYQLSADMAGVPGWISPAMRLAEKFARLSTLMKKGKLQNEQATELFSDIALIAAITHTMFERESSHEYNPSHNTPDGESS